MNLWKLSALIVFGVVTGLCVSYAHSASQKVLVYKSSAWTGSCSLRAEQTGGSTWNYVAAGKSGTRFEGAWPLTPGDLFLSVGPKVLDNERIIGIEGPLPEQTLTIKFDHVNGKIRPVSYTYDNVKLRTETKGMIQPHTCQLK